MILKSLTNWVIDYGLWIKKEILVCLPGLED
jgi:hypothetical protein